MSMPAAGTAAEGTVHACVLSGGGGAGAYEVGALKALLDNSRIEPEIYCGTSVGAFNAAVMAQGSGGDARGAVRHLEQLWLDEVAQQPGGCENGVYRVRGNPLPWIDPRCLLRNPARVVRDTVKDGTFLFANTVNRLLYLARDDTDPVLERLLEVPDIAAFVSTAPFRRLLEKHVDLDRLRSSPKQLITVATNWTRGQPVVFLKRDIVGAIGRDALRASAAIPAVFPPVVIGGEEYVDGGVLLNTPLQPVIDEKPADTRHLVIHVFYLEPRLRDLPIEKVSSSFAVLDRMDSLILAGRMKNHIDTIESIDRIAGEREAEIAHELAAQSVGMRHARELGKCRITIHRYRPRQSLGGTLALLNFKRRQVESLLRLGYEETRQHLCASEACLLS